MFIIISVQDPKFMLMVLFYGPLNPLINPCFIGFLGSLKVVWNFTPPYPKGNWFDDTR